MANSNSRHNLRKGFQKQKQLQDGCNQTGVIKTYKKTHCCKQQTIRLLRYRPNTRDILTIFSKRFYTISRFKRNTKRKINIKEHRFFIQTKSTQSQSSSWWDYSTVKMQRPKYPIDETVFASDSGFNEERRLV